MSEFVIEVGVDGKFIEYGSLKAFHGEKASFCHHRMKSEFDVDDKVFIPLKIALVFIKSYRYSAAIE